MLAADVPHYKVFQIKTLVRNADKWQLYNLSQYTFIQTLLLTHFNAFRTHL